MGSIPTGRTRCYSQNKMARWSDEVERGENYDGSSLHKEIRAYFEDKLEEDLIGLRWENDYLKQRLAEMAILKIQERRARAAAA